ncbi:MAG: hypothetical protein HWE34_15550 [Methylocystaceae bacterium]|jgi:hypothetical protein|nr:hypothetical protein [Methylocystaceae bacterium]
MSSQQTFLIRYGIHNFVSCMENSGNIAFLIQKSERQTMVRHAQKLIQGAYGEQADIRVI